MGWFSVFGFILDEKLAFESLYDTVRYVKIYVTLKMHPRWDGGYLNYPVLSKIEENSSIK